MIRVECFLRKREVFYRIYYKVIILLCFFVWNFSCFLLSFELKKCSEIGQKAGRTYFRCEVELEEHEEGLYLEGFESSLIHPGCNDIQYKVKGTPISRYIPSFKKQRQFYNQHISLIVSCLLSKNFDESIPIMLLVSSVVLYANKTNKAEVKVAPCFRKKRGIMGSPKSQAKSVEQSAQEVSTTAVFFPSSLINRVWYLYRFLYRCWVFLFILLFCMNLGGYKTSNETFFCMILIIFCGLYPFIQWDKCSFMVVLGALFFLGFASSYCMLSDSVSGYTSWWKRTFARICAFSIMPLFVYWYVSTTIENPPSTEVALQHQEGGKFT